MSLTPAQRHALRTICRLGTVDPDAVRRSMREPVRSIIAKGLAHYTAAGLEPTNDGWALAARMRPPIHPPRLRPNQDPLGLVSMYQRLRESGLGIPETHEALRLRFALTDEALTAVLAASDWPGKPPYLGG